MKSVDQFFAEYSVCHQNPINKIVHWICIPLIMLTLLGLLWEVRLPVISDVDLWWANLACLLIGVCLIYYFRLSMTLALGMVVWSAANILILRYWQVEMDGPVWIPSIIGFVVAWIIQFVGHQIEGKRPKFIDDLRFLLIGPLWLLGFIYRKCGIKY